MVEVDVKKIEKEVENINILISEYEEIEINLFNQLKNSCINWQDGNSKRFEEQIYFETKESEVIINSLKNRKNIYEYIYKKYGEIGKTIKSNLNKENSLLNIIEECYEEAVSIINEFNRIDRSFSYREQSQITAQKKKIEEIKESFIAIRKSTTEILKNIKQIEETVEEKIKELEEIKINTFEFELM